MFGGKQGDADSFSSFVALKAQSSKGFTINQVYLSPEVQESHESSSCSCVFDLSYL
jgi:hypothetical protein